MIKDILRQVKKLDVFTKNNINSLFLGNYRSAFRGRGIEFADIRQYDIGDDVRDIDWKTTSKQGDVYVKTYHESRDNTLFFIIDGSESMYFSSTQKKKYELLLETFALTAFAAVQNGDRVGMLFYGNGPEKVFPPKKGRKNVLKILKFCIEQYGKKEFALYTDKPEKKFHTVLALLKHSASIFWLTGNMENTPEIQRNIRMLKSKNDLVPIVFVDPAEEKWTEAGEFTFADSRTGEMTSMIVTPEIIKNYQKIYNDKKETFQKFFQKNRMETLFISHTERIYQKLFLFFQSRQRNN
jgi:uncharacterized protein (DUF58 family)